MPASTTQPENSRRTQEVVNAARSLSADNPGLFCFPLEALGERLPKGTPAFGVKGAGACGGIYIDFDSVPGFVVIAPVN